MDKYFQQHILWNLGITRGVTRDSLRKFLMVTQVLIAAQFSLAADTDNSLIYWHADLSVFVCVYREDVYGGCWWRMRWEECS